VLASAIAHHFGKNFSVSSGNVEVQCEGSLHEKRMYFILVATMQSSSEDESQVFTTYKLGRDWLYDRKIRSHERAATEMAEAATNALANEVESGAFVDEHMRDQLVIFQALATGMSEVYAGIDGDGEQREPSLHARTAEWVAKQLLGVKFDAENTCEGIGVGTDLWEKENDLENEETTGLNEDIHTLELT
jgi:RNA 3'-terminal phosphate cyclase (ATP)